MGFHTYDVERADHLEDPDRYQWCSSEELLTLVAPYQGATVADLGSGTGFYTDVVAPHAGTVYAVDVQPAMHEYYEQKGRPANVTPVSASIETLPLDENSLDAAFSTMTYHEFSGERSMQELARVLRPGSRLVTVDWSANGTGETGPPLSERHGLGQVVSAMTDAGFKIDHAVTRTETFVCRARR